MNRARESQPARIVKRADVSVEPAYATRAADGTHGATNGPTNGAGVEVGAATARVKHVSKEARLVPNANGASSSTAIEVRCSCGEWTRVELAIADQASDRSTGGQR